MQKNKQLWMLTGGNGAGKTTFYEKFLKPKDMPFVNADFLAQHLHPDEPEKFSYQAAAQASKLRAELLRDGATFCFETVFSHPSKIDFLADAKALGYQIVLVYIHLDSDQLNQARVDKRVNEGGHFVPADKITSRIPRTMMHITTSLPLVDLVMLYDNTSSTDPYRRVASISNNTLQLHCDTLPTWAKEILVNYL